MPSPGRWTSTSVPCPRPGLARLTVPPCSSTRPRTSGRPIPGASPPPVPSNSSAMSPAGMPRPRSLTPHHDVPVAAVRRQLKVAARLRKTGGVVQQMKQHLFQVGRVRVKPDGLQRQGHGQVLRTGVQQRSRLPLTTASGSCRVQIQTGSGRMAASARRAPAGKGSPGRRPSGSVAEPPGRARSARLPGIGRAARGGPAARRRPRHVTGRAARLHPADPAARRAALRGGG